MKRSTNVTERGQALVLIVLAIVAVLGFSALAIDGGMLYAERRRAQNAADTAVFAAAMAGLDKKTEAEITNAGLTQAGMNGFVTDGMNSVAVHHPPVAPLAPAQYVGDYQYYMVVITTEFKPFFAQFVYSGRLQNTVWAIAKAKPSENASPGNAIFSTGPSKCHGVWFAGAALTTVSGGHVYSSSDREADENCAAGKNQGSANLILQEGSIKTHGGFNGDDVSDPDDITFDPGYGIEENAPLEPTPLIKPPSCAGVAGNTVAWDDHWSGSYTIQPGIYNEIDIGSSDDVTMTSGIYCLDGNLNISAGAVLDGTSGVMIYMRGSKDDPSSIIINGGATVNLNAPAGTSLKDSAGKEWSGMLVYMDYDNTGTVGLNGNGFTTYVGTVYAPGPTTNDYQNSTNKEGKCTISGTGESINISAQLICYSVHFTGSAKITITFNEELLFHEDPHVTLDQ